MMRKQKTGNSLLLIVLFAWLSIALFAGVIANHKPLYLKIEGENYFPAFSKKPSIEVDNRTLNYETTDFKKLSADLIIFAPVPYSPGRSDLYNSYKGPFDHQVYLSKNNEEIKLSLRFRHWLGTDNRGADLLAGIIHAFRHSFIIAIIAIVVAVLFGLLLGTIAGYFGDDKLLMKRINLYITTITGLYALFFMFKTKHFELLDLLTNQKLFFLLYVLLVVLVTTILIYGLSKLLIRIKLPLLHQKITISIDTFIVRLMEIFTSIPRLIFIIAFASVVKPSLYSFSIIIGLTAWADIARISRAQVIQISKLDYVLAAKAIGVNTFSLLTKHILPNCMGPVLVTICFVFSGTILSESGLSFIGIGIPADVVTFGSLMISGYNNFNAWWMMLFPGLCVFSIVLFFNYLADRYFK